MASETTLLKSRRSVPYYAEVSFSQRDPWSLVVLERNEPVPTRNWHNQDTIEVRRMPKNCKQLTPRDAINTFPHFTRLLRLARFCARRWDTFKILRKRWPHGDPHLLERRWIGFDGASPSLDLCSFPTGGTPPMGGFSCKHPPPLKTGNPKKACSVGQGT